MAQDNLVNASLLYQGHCKFITFWGSLPPSLLFSPAISCQAPIFVKYFQPPIKNQSLFQQKFSCNPPLQTIFFLKRCGLVVPWCNTYHCWTIPFNKAWTQVLHRFKFCMLCVRDPQWWGSLAMILAGYKANRLLLVNHTTKTIHHHHHHRHLHQHFLLLIQLKS